MTVLITVLGTMMIKFSSTNGTCLATHDATASNTAVRNVFTVTALTVIYNVKNWPKYVSS